MKSAPWHQADVKRAVQAVRRAGLVVTGVEVTREGVVRILTGGASETQLSSLERWEIEHGRRSAQRA